MKKILLPFLLAFSMATSAQSTNSTPEVLSGKASKLILSNRFLEVVLYPDRPVVAGYTYKPTKAAFGGGGENGLMVLNGEVIPWEKWIIKVQEVKVPDWQGTWYTYQMSLPGKAFRFEVCFMLVDSRMIFQLKNIQDPAQEIVSVGWQNLSLITATDPEYEYWRFRAGDPDPSSGGKRWTFDERGKLGNAAPGEYPSIHGAIWRTGGPVVFGFGNYPVFPYLHRITPEKTYQIGPNTWQYRVRNLTQPPLQFEVVFLDDLNRDGLTDFSDYALSINRRLPDLDPFYYETCWYKIFLDNPDLGMVTTLREAEDIVGAIRNVTDGMPQAPHLVGWQYKGHDTFYPSYGDINTDIGGAFAISRLERYCKEHNALLTFHCNLDDAYRNSLDWNDSYIYSNMEQFGVNGSVSHCLDVESGQAFRRLDELFKFVHLQKTLQVDNTRVGVSIPEKGIGLHEELIAGLMPKAEYFRGKGITLTTEGQNGLPFDLTKVFAGVWHHDFSQQALPLWHRKLVGGGRGSHTGHLTRMDYALGSSVHQDISCRQLSKETIDPAIWKKNNMDSWCPPGGLTMSFEKDWDLIVQVLYEGTFLYHFYLEREMTDYREIPGGMRIAYNSGEAMMEIVNNELTVRMGETVVAHNEERFIPRGNSIFAYSRNGGTFDYVLPAEFKGRKMEAFALSKEGRKAFTAYSVKGNTIRITLGSTAPVRLIFE